MPDFHDIYLRAETNAGGDEQLQQKLPLCRSKTELLEETDDRYLSMMTRCVFRAGFVWRVIDNKWPDFEKTFDQFNPLVVAHYSDDKLDELAKNPAIVRNRTKIKATRDNAVFILDTQQSHGSFARVVAEWPANEMVQLWQYLKATGSRLGGNTGPMLLRSMGKDTFILTNDVSAALVNLGFMDHISPASKRDQLAVQAIFINLQQQSGRPFCEISRILAMCIG